MEREEVGWVGSHDSVYHERDLTGESVFERFICDDCEKTAPTAKEIEDVGCSS